MPSHTTEHMDGIKNVAILWRDEKKFARINRIEDFRNEYPKEELRKGQDVKRITILYIYLEKTEHHQAGLAKMYLKLSQSIGCKEDGPGYRFDDPMKECFEYRRQKDKQLHNKVFTIIPN